MATPFLRSGRIDSVLILNENGHPLYAAALPLREALRLQQQQAAANCLAIPVPHEQGDRIDWYAPIAGSVTSWAVANEAERADALRQLEATQATLNAISLRARQAAQPSQQLFAALLAKTMQFPDRHAVYLVAGQPVITFWGCVKPDGKISDDPLSCLRPAPLAPPETVPAPPSPPAAHPLRRYLLPALMAPIALLLLWRHYLPAAESAPAPENNVPVIATLPVPVVAPYHPQLPLGQATVFPVAETAPAIMSKNTLTLPSVAVKMGSTAFLNGKWRVTLAQKEPISMLYQFNHGKGIATIVQGENITCRAEVSAGLMPSGNLVINSRTKARCSNGSRYQIPELVCQQGETGAADCTGRYDPETVFPITMKRESK
ncbi:MULTISPECIES: SrfA family protein [unclassified Serratia (in: enterobacteria)]|uniref:SrfA family protein n=1 Tax=unclassified Serratia (in: enterobacteria) TaxID=2647522 RepID=UPI00307638E8